ncbi:uncharacterized protein EURHEDRAFT_260592 [Aspergillus ruber CBS 135680]|uniref:Uncharacterized protein n=1 Tax=Aspergillus ruber (strain CBS 135680) TaxID=1388766 RepID=A0A017SML9_ASPRC|nr:uncharacterized protein EURHEDRAFT_260592 [Aspergillus ruber CBS 135680]EYE97884.1 hypothetical protein EURHEDRAFT_260592 [Aspergillus ruber CBS 135680]
MNRQVIIIRLPSFCCANINEHLRLASDVSELLSQHGGNEAQSAIRNTIHLAAPIQCLACTVLSTMLQNFRAALKASLSESPSVLDKERKAGWPPFWAEEYQTYWALWRLQRYYGPGKLLRGEVSLMTTTTTTLPRKEELCGEAEVGLPRRFRK